MLLVPLWDIVGAKCMSKNTARFCFQIRNLKSIEDVKSWCPEKLITIRQSLFIPPNAPEEEITLEREKELSKTAKGGFLCALWRK